MKIKSVFKHRLADFGKRSNRGRRGGMLLIVLIILAVTVILLSSALMVTVSSRKRYYVSAEQDQANLTAMSVAKLIEKAIYEGDITNTDIENLTKGTGTTSAFEDGTIVIPGLSNTAESKTTVKFSKRAKGSDDSGYIIVEVSTLINAGVEGSGSTETVRLVLQKQPPVPDGFQALIAIQPSTSANTNLGNAYYGDNAPSKASNMVVVNNKTNAGASGKVFCSDMVFKQGVSAEGGGHFEGDVIFYGDEAGYNVKSGSGDGIRTDGYIIALGKDNTKADLFIKGTDGTSGGATLENGFVGAFYGKGLYLKNFKAAIDGGVDAGGGINTNSLQFVNGIYAADNSILYYRNNKQTELEKVSTATITWANTPQDPMVATAKTEMETLATFYSSDKIKAIIERPLDNSKDPTDPPGAKQVALESIKTFLKEDAFSGTNKAATLATLTNITSICATGGTVTDAACYIDLSTNVDVKGKVVFDLTKDITIYLVGNQTLTFKKNGSFNFVGTKYFGRIISYDNNSIVMEADSDYQDTSMTAAQITTASPTGIVAVQDELKVITQSVNMSSKNTYTSDINTSFQKQVTNQKSALLITYPSTTLDSEGKVILDAVTKKPVKELPLPVPHFICYLFGQSKITVGSGAVMQGYYGMYNKSSLLAFDGTPIVYARMEVTEFSTGGSGQPHLPYCPPPAGDDGGGMDGSKSKYVLYGYEKV